MNDNKNTSPKANETEAKAAAGTKDLIETLQIIMEAKDRLKDIYKQQRVGMIIKDKDAQQNIIELYSENVNTAFKNVELFIIGEIQVLVSNNIINLIK